MAIRCPGVQLLLMALSLASVGCGGGDAPVAPATTTPPSTGGGSGTSLARVALNDLGAGNYMGFMGGLYPGGSNTVPAQHNAAGLARATAIQPLDTNGNPSASGVYVLLSIGMSNTTQEFCSQGTNQTCDSWTFVGQANADLAVNRTSLIMVNGAAGGRTADRWTSAASAEYDRIRDTRLTPAGLSERQVQIAWVKVANAQPAISLPSAQSDAATLVTHMGNIARAMQTRYPNLRMIFFSSRIYAGYATTTLSPEPYAYESGLAVKWVVQAQIDQMQNGGTVVDARAGDLNYTTGVAPWLAWGPYLWADGLNARSDGLIWERTDLEGDGTHPSQSGERKVGTLLLNFFKTSPYARCWFVLGGTCP